MPRIRPDIAALRPYVPGRPIDEVASELGIDAGSIVKLASNESPDGPFPGVVDAVLRVLGESHRYPDNDNHELGAVLADVLGIPAQSIWFANGSVSLIGHIALAVGGPGTSAVYAWPSFVMYRIVSKWAMTKQIEVPLTPEFSHDLGAMRSAIRDDTTVVYLCNPNNPTGTAVSRADVTAFVESIPEDVLVVVDEAYHHFVADPDYSTAMDLALGRSNVIVLRTFSKVFGLASHRVGFGVAQPETISELMKAQAPFSVSQTAQAAAMVSLGDAGELQRRIELNAGRRHSVLAELDRRQIERSHTETNFVYMRVGRDSGAAASQFTEQGVIVRPMSGGWLRVTFGTDAENKRFLAALDDIGSWQ